MRLKVKILLRGILVQKKFAVINSFLVKTVLTTNTGSIFSNLHWTFI